MAVVIWLIIALIAGIAEAATVSLISVWFALGAVAAAIAAAFGLGAIAQVIIFLAASLILMALTAPLCRKFRMGEKTPTNADRLIGRTGIITEDVDPLQGKGEVKVGGQVWSVQVRGGGRAKVGDNVIVEDIEGAHLVVSLKNDIENEEEE
ncbi:MAG: NfeD family protein [Clostridia bacterium]|nr:NfeD family protein [Clostridia bacterium]